MKGFPAGQRAGIVSDREVPVVYDSGSLGARTLIPPQLSSKKPTFGAE